MVDVLWVLAISLSAGISGENWVLGLAAPVLLFLLYRGLSRTHLLFLLLLSGLFFFYGHRSIQHFHRSISWFRLTTSQSQEPVVLRGFVASFPQYGAGTTTFLFRTSVRQREITLVVRAKNFSIGYGDSLSISARMRNKRGADSNNSSFDSYLLGRGAAGFVRAGPEGIGHLDGHNGNYFNRRWFWPVHASIRKILSQGLGGRSAIPLALLLGQRGKIDRSMRRSFVHLGLSHLLALSGLHLGAIAGVVLLAQRLCTRRNLGLLLLLLIAYVGVVGLILSLYRALIMAGVLILATSTQRTRQVFPALVTAFIVILLFHPYAFFSVGFQLSFLATLGVLVCVQSLKEPRLKHWLGRFLWRMLDSIRVSIAAQIYVAPIVLHVFGKISLLSPLSTLVYLPFVLLTMGLSTICVGVSFASRDAGLGLFSVLAVFVDWLSASLVVASRITPEPAEFLPPNPVIYYAGLTCFSLAKGRVWPKLIGGGLVLGSVLLSLFF